MNPATEKEILDKLRRIDETLDRVLNKPKEPIFMDLPRAAEHLDVTPRWLRGMCKKGMIHSAPKSATAKNKHFIVEVNGAAEVIAKGGPEIQLRKRFETK